MGHLQQPLCGLGELSDAGGEGAADLLGVGVGVGVGVRVRVGVRVLGVGVRVRVRGLG